MFNDMINLGGKIKKIRLEKGLTQAELAEGICTQASISNLEKNASVPSLLILLEIGNRLNIEFSELSEYAVEQASPAVTVFKKVQNLRSQFKLKEAYNLVQELDVNDLKTNHEKKQYYYYLGITSLLGYNKISDATYNFNLGLNLETEAHLEFLDILITNGIGLAYFMESEHEKALTYFEKSLTLLDAFLEQTDSSIENGEVLKIYFTSAKFYSEIGNYNKALNLCELSIALQKKLNMNYELDRLYYEKAFNLIQLGERKGAKEYYYYAGVLSKISGNEILSRVIQKDMDTFDLGTIPY
uniref:helix-turn-helix transcriptional regulator n=2 Tax=Carnobacterium maltaromaticum TaxID=2751 RepID=UPI00344BADDE